jgi:hypothetical protein
MKMRSLNFNNMTIHRNLNLNLNNSLGKVTKFSELRFPIGKVSLQEILLEKDGVIMVTGQNLVVQGAKSALYQKVKFPGVQNITVVEVGVSGLPSLPCLDIAA